MTETPILLLLFNRPDKTERLISHLSKIKPKNIFLAADGPRSEEEAILTDKTRMLTIDLIDWECNLTTLFREKNLGLRIAVSEAITWFFNHVDQGIILEDDCLPDPTFIDFCSNMLDCYKNDEKIMHISALNSFPQPSQKESFHFSIYPRVWGWASWKRAWQLYEDRPEMYLEHIKQLNTLYPDILSRSFWKLILEKMELPESKTRQNSWAYYWALSIRKNYGLCITPNMNLVKNIGFDVHATNTRKLNSLSKRINKLSVDQIKPPFIHPNNKTANQRQDDIFLKHHLIDSNWKLFKVYLKAFFPFLKPFS